MRNDDRRTRPNRRRKVVLGPDGWRVLRRDGTPLAGPYPTARGAEDWLDGADSPRPRKKKTLSCLIP